jgi:hypothetical protein
MAISVVSATYMSHTIICSAALRVSELEAVPVEVLVDDALDELFELLELPDELCPLELELFPLEPLPLPLELEPELLEPELLLELDLPLPPSLAKRGVPAMPSDINVTAQTIDFLNFNMMYLLKVNS